MTNPLTKDDAERGAEEAKPKMPWPMPPLSEAPHLPPQLASWLGTMLRSKLFLAMPIRCEVQQRIDAEGREIAEALKGAADIFASVQGKTVEFTARNFPETLKRAADFIDRHIGRTG